MVLLKLIFRSKPSECCKKIKISKINKKVLQNIKIVIYQIYRKTIKDFRKRIITYCKTDLNTELTTNPRKTFLRIFIMNTKIIENITKIVAKVAINLGTILLL